MDKYSFLASIYRNTKVDELEICVKSMVEQTLKPEQIVIVIDGEVPEDVRAYIDNLARLEPALYTIVPLETNVGLGLALAEGMKHCRNELIARIDTDDINVLDRIEKQINYLLENNLDVVGSNIAEFIGDTNNVVSHRDVPEKHEDVCEYLKSRCPFNHMAVLMRKSKVEEAGGYQNWFYDEDSFLWVRMYLVDAKFGNIQEDLVNVRIDEDTFKRRGGYKYYKSERDLFKYMYKHKIISWFAYQKAKFIRFVVQVLMPNNVRQWFFKKFARS